MQEDPEFLQRQLVTYLGNKRALLPFIGAGLEQVKRRLGRDRLRVADLFSGSGVVARYLKSHASLLVVNDLEAYARALSECHLASRRAFDVERHRAQLAELEAAVERSLAPGFITELYAPRDEARITAEDRVFYTRRNAMYLDTARQALERLPVDDRRFFLGPLLAEASVHANTSGVFKGFYKSADGVGQYGGRGRDALGRICGEIALALPVLSRFEAEVEIHQEDANALVAAMPAVDVAYLDPPYNQHPYGSNYFMLNLLVDYQRPARISRVSGIPVDWRRSRYNQRGEVLRALEQLVRECPASFVLVSYSSEGFVSLASLTRMLEALGAVTTLETTYNTFRGSRNLSGRPLRLTEYLLLLEKS